MVSYGVVYSSERRERVRGVCGAVARIPEERGEEGEKVGERGRAGNGDGIKRKSQYATRER